MAPRDTASSLAVLLALTTCGCAGDGERARTDGGHVLVSTDAGPETGEIPRSINAILRARCQPCHSDPPVRYASLALVTLEQIRAPSVSNPDKPVFEAMATRLRSERFPMPPKESPEFAAMSDAERHFLLLWAERGAPQAQ